MACASIAGALTQVTLPLDPQETVVTCFSGLDPATNQMDPNGNVLAIVDTRIPEIAGNPTPVLDQNWMVSFYHNELGNPAHKWNQVHLGQVFGLCEDDAAAPNIYVAASTIYGTFPAGPGGMGAIYKIDGTSGNICVFAQLPNGGPGLGNLAYDPASKHIFATDHEDGLIYSLDTTLGCGVQQWVTYNHGVAGRTAASLPTIPDAGTNNTFTALGRRVWGVCVNADRLYYSVWWEDAGRTNATEQNEIWSVQITASGGFVPGSAIKEATIPNHYAASAPIADIEFTKSGAMLAAERTIGADTGGLDTGMFYAHQSRVLKFTGSSGSWTMLPDNTYLVGSFSTGTNAAGGVTSDCDENVWATGDAIHYSVSTGHTDVLYGLHRIAAAGNTADSPFSALGYVIGLGNPLYSGGYAKTQIGEVDYIRECKTTVDCPNPVTTTCTGGNMDNFAQTDGTEYASPSASLLAAVTCAGGALTTFDTPAIRQCFVHTLRDCCELPSNNCKPVGVHLSIGLHAGENGLPTNKDIIALGQNGSPLWQLPIANLTTSGAWQAGTWNPGQSAVFNLDLFSLPTSASGTYNLVNDMQKCELDVLVAQYTMVDFVTMTIDWCCDEVTPEGEGGVDGPCMDITNGVAACDNGDITYNFDVTNLSGIPAAWLLVTPQTPGVTITPQQIATNLADGATGSYSVVISGATPGEQVCFTVTLQDDKHKECCSDTICIDNPCNCLLIPDEKIVCNDDGTYSDTFTITNYSSFTMEHMYLFVDSPAGATITPGYINLPTLAPGQTSAPITITLGGASAGDEVCFTITVHDQKLDECCSFQHCVTLPDCCVPDGTLEIVCPDNAIVDCNAQYMLNVEVHDNCGNDVTSQVQVKIDHQIDTSIPGLQCVVVTVVNAIGVVTVRDCCVTVLDNCNPAVAAGARHTADVNKDEIVEISELLRVIQFFNVGALHCDANSEDGFAPGAGNTNGSPHSSDFENQDWRIELNEMLRLVQLYNIGGYAPCVNGEDGYCAVSR